MAITYIGLLGNESLMQFRYLHQELSEQRTDVRTEMEGGDSIYFIVYMRQITIPIQLINQPSNCMSEISKY
jgi:hypothetical protein